jgi:murein DD-endopeptidase MepM/ murein hydrolase activator NlpD
MKKFLCIVAILLALTSGISFAQLSKNEKAKKSSLSNTLGKVKAKRNQLRTALKTKRAEVDNVMDQVHDVDAEMSRIEDKLEKTESNLTKSKREQQQLSTDLRIQTEKLDAIKRKVAKRLRAMYIQGEGSALAVLAESESISDLASRKALLERIANRDREIFTEGRALRDTVLAKKKELDLKVTQIASLIQEQQTTLAELQGIRDKKKKIFSVLKAQEHQLEDKLEDMERESQKLEAQIAAFQAKSVGGTVFRGKFIMPVNGRRSSGFGYRTHPISGRKKMHTGIDYAAPTGTPIKAAGAGKVITATYLRGYGNTVVIDHGGGISTLYGHCSRLFVTSGQNVTTGQKIAAVGSTGYSTGPHLHFEVRVNGKPVNPSGR